MESVVDFLVRLAPQPSCPRCGETAQLVKTPEACHSTGLLGRALIATARELLPAIAPTHAQIKIVCSPCGVVACSTCVPWFRSPTTSRRERERSGPSVRQLPPRAA